MLCFLLCACVITLSLGCTSGQMVAYDIKTQAVCREVTRSPRRDCRWAAGLNMADQVIEKGSIAAYQIRWFNGRWSGWIVPGVNDLDHKYNPSAQSCALPYRARSLRRLWSYFSDHTHKMIICKPT